MLTVTIANPTSLSLLWICTLQPFNLLTGGWAEGDAVVASGAGALLAELLKVIMQAITRPCENTNLSTADTWTYLLCFLHAIHRQTF